MNWRELCWEGRFWGPEGALEEGLRVLWPEFRKHKKSGDFSALQWVLSEMSSLYYAAAGNALRVQARRNTEFTKLFWIICGWWLLERSLRWSQKLWRGHLSVATPTMCEVRQSICRIAAELPWHEKKMLREAQAAVDLGITLARYTKKDYVYPLLLAGKADLLLKKNGPVDEVSVLVCWAKSFCDNEVQKLSALLPSEEVVEHKRQYCRAYRRLSSLCWKLHWELQDQQDQEYALLAEECREKAMRLAVETGAHDQLGKM